MFMAFTLCMEVMTVELARNLSSRTFWKFTLLGCRRGRYLLEGISMEELCDKITWRGCREVASCWGLLASRHRKSWVPRKLGML